MKGLTVKELINILKKFPSNTHVAIQHGYNSQTLKFVSNIKIDYDKRYSDLESVKPNISSDTSVVFLSSGEIGIIVKDGKLYS